MFLTELVCKKEDGDLWDLYEPLVYDAGRFGVFTVPARFRTDLASIPHFLPIFLQVGTDAPAVVHDWLYRTGITSKDTADRVFYMALRESGVGVLRSTILYNAVKVGGWPMWTKYRSEDK